MKTKSDSRLCCYTDKASHPQVVLTMIKENLPEYPSSGNNKVRFSTNSDFEKVLRQRVQKYFKDTGLPKRDCPGMYLKTAIVLLWAVASYSLLLFSGLPLPLLLLVALSMSMALNAVGFNIMHDAVHGAYSSRSGINKIMGLFMDLIGGSSYFWYWKHNYLHHSYPNITGHDDDIEAGIFARFSPHQKRYSFHRFQHIYIWFLYGFLAIKWHIVDDFHTFFTKRINNHKVQSPSTPDTIIFFCGKALFFTIAFVIPSFFYPFIYVVLFYVLIAFLQGVQMSVVLQLAHCNEVAEFPVQDKESNSLDTSWIVHQLKTTADFGRNNIFLRWYVGGLNFQVEHHLFPRICHINYPAISKIVETTCREFNVPYFAYDSLFSGIRSHYQWIRHLGGSSGSFSS